MSHHRGVVPFLAMLGLLFASSSVLASFTTFESGQVRPLALSPSGDKLYVVNTPDNQLEIFDVDVGGITHSGSVPVGLEPVAVAARTDGEVWVVNHLSDSVSIIDVSVTPARVVRTLLVGDEPRDIVFAGPGGTRAFVTTARRGQNLPPDLPAALTRAGMPRALVWVFDATALDDTLGGTPLAILELFGDTPRALAASADGTRVYAAVFHSGNQTTTVNEGAVCNDSTIDATPSGPCSVFGTQIPGGLPPPETNFDGVLRPETGLIVRYDSSSDEWNDELGRNWSTAVRFDLPDEDVFVIDASASPPVQLAGAAGFRAGIGTVLFNMVVDPTDSSRVYVSNTEARNEARFEGPGLYAGLFGGTTVRGHLHEARITVIDGSSVAPRHLNKHLDYTVVPSPPRDLAKSLATPNGMAVTGDGTTLYVAAFGSAKIGVFDATALSNDTFVPDSADHITLSAGGPSGLVLDEAHNRLYVLTRFDNAVSVVDTMVGGEVDHQLLHNPEPPEVVEGRPFLYDATMTSSNGEASCASCHIFGDFDSLGWDLGNPDDSVLNNPNPFRVVDPIGMSFPDHHPMKGPMATQSLRGMAAHGPMHWRGDRTGGNDPGGDALDETEAFLKFNGAFDGLIGLGGPIPDLDMEAFAAFILAVRYPPNPVRALDNSLDADEEAGRDFFMNSFPSDVFQSCNGCHVLNPTAGHFGSDGFSSFEFEPQLMKIPHLRNMYQKVGMFGMPDVAFFNRGDSAHKGPQVRGFGFLHDGSTDTLFRFHDSTVFNQNNPGGFPIPNPGGIPNGAAGDELRRKIEAFMLAFDSNLAPIVGQQATLRGVAGDAGVALNPKQLQLRDSDDDNEAKRRVSMQASIGDNEFDGIPTPVPESPDDPRCNGDPVGTVKARFVVASTTGQAHSTGLACQNWSLTTTGSGHAIYRYKDKELDDGTAKSVLWKNDSKIKVMLQGKGPTVLDFDLENGLGQGIVSAFLKSGGVGLCVRCTGFEGEDGSDGERFKSGIGSCEVPTPCFDTPDTRLDLMIVRAEQPLAECDVVAKGTVAGEARGWHYRPATNDFQSDRAAEAPLSDASLRALAAIAGQELTYTCQPPGSGLRLGVDRDEDGYFDRDEIDGGSDPADPGSTP